MEEGGEGGAGGERGGVLNDVNVAIRGKDSSLKLEK